MLDKLSKECCWKAKMPPIIPKMDKITRTNVFFFKLVNHQGQRLCTNRKILLVSQGIFMWIIKALALTVKMLLAKVKFLTDLRKNRMIKTPRMTELKWPSLSFKLILFLGGVKNLQNDLSFWKWINLFKCFIDDSINCTQNKKLLSIYFLLILSKDFTNHVW